HRQTIPQRDDGGRRGGRYGRSCCLQVEDAALSRLGRRVRQLSLLRLQTLTGNTVPLGRNLDAYESSALSKGSNSSGPGATERVEHDSSGWTDAHKVHHQTNRLSGLVDLGLFVPVEPKHTRKGADICAQWHGPIAAPHNELRL